MARRKNPKRKNSNAIDRLSERLEMFSKKLEEYIAESEKWRKENERWKKEWTRKWGEISNRLGTLVEDFVIPNIGSVTEEIFGKKPRTILPRVSRNINGRTAEFDVIVEVDEEYILLSETKSKLTLRDVSEMEDRIREFREFFPEFRGRKVVPLLSSLNVEKRVLDYATKKGVYVMGLKGEIMTVLNPFPVKQRY